MKEKIQAAIEWAMPFIFAVVMFGVLAGMVGLLTGCNIQTAPVKADYHHAPCYAAADCMYRLKDSPDKSLCAADLQECRAWQRYEKCMSDKNRAREHDFEKCWLLLNQK